MSPWTIAKGIKTPRGAYVPKTNNLTDELVAAAKFAGIESFNVKIDGMYYDDPDKLPTNDLSAINKDIAIENIEVEARDTAGRK